LRTVYGLVVALSVGVASAEAAPLPAPIAKASDGSLQCYSPNVQTKSCRSLSTYQRRADGTLVNPATVLISNSPAITMTAATTVQIKNGQVCGALRADDIAAARFQISGGTAGPELNAKLRRVVASSMKGVIGKEICTAYISVAGVLTAKASVDGAHAVSEPVIWVSPSDGYKVQP
jgi:hypothetical protein